MGTRSRIGILEKDGAVTSIYCHFDGYPSYNGKILLNDYKDEFKVRQLILFGDLSSLGNDIGVFNDYKSPSKLFCCAYGRDRGEIDTKATNHSCNEWPSGGEYHYLWDGAWKFYTVYGEKKWLDLASYFLLTDILDDK